MRPLRAIIVRNDTVEWSLTGLTVQAEAVATAQPGQCLALRQPDALAVMAEPFPFAALEASERSADVLYYAVEALAPCLSLLPPGDEIDVLGPWGRPFPIDRLARHDVLIGSGRRLVGLLALAAALAHEGV